jgi:hypothetical protein
MKKENPRQNSQTPAPKEENNNPFDGELSEDDLEQVSGGTEREFTQNKQKGANKDQDSIDIWLRQ